MPISNILIVITLVAVSGMLLFYRPLVASSSWRAIITPLASIMGSGFLVCAPLLYANIGNFAVFAMAGLLGLGYGVGSVIRFNIRYGEPHFEHKDFTSGPSGADHRLHTAHRECSHKVNVEETAGLLEKVSHFALSGAYCISVSYYLQLLASFSLQPLSLGRAWYGKALVTLILGGIGAIGALRGLKGIERVERTVVGINLSLIVALIVGLLYYNITALGHGTWRLSSMAIPSNKMHVLRILMGMLIIVQGFETSRFLGSEHSREERIKTMRWAQLISTGIYILFLALMAVVINTTGNGNQTGITAIVNLSKIVAPILPLLITITAIGSQFSAATADDAGCSGLLESILKQRVSPKFNYLIVSGMAIALTWLTDVYQIISYASRAFALYYTLQCIVALLVLKKTPSLRFPRAKAVLFGILAVVCALVTLFGIPAG